MVQDVSILIVGDVLLSVNMIWSVRNKIVLSSHGFLLYIGNSCSLLKLSFQQLLSIMLFIIFKTKGVFKQDDFKLLQKTGAILDSEETFLNSIRMLENRFRASYRGFDLTICISESCNFSCRYCYEKTEKKTCIISYKVIDRLIDNLKQQENTFSSIHITLYGGEPLLSIDRILYLHNKLKSLNKKLFYSMITNGYLLSLENYKVLLKLPIDKYQITIDGFQNSHNFNRPHKHKFDTYSVILRNLTDIYNFCKQNEMQPNITIRVNIDKRNAETFVDFYKYINSTFSNCFSINSAFIEDYNKRNNPNILSTRQRIKFCLRNFSNNIYETRYLPHVFNRLNYCCATLSKSIVIDAHGNVYKCWTDIGIKKRVIFNVFSPRNRNLVLESQYYIAPDPLYDKKCKHCFLLFSCYGGCPRNIVDKKSRNCTLAKYRPKQFLEALYNRRIKNEN